MRYFLGVNWPLTITLSVLRLDIYIRFFIKKNFKTIAYRIAANLLMERKLMKMAIMVIINRKVNYNYTLG